MNRFARIALVLSFVALASWGVGTGSAHAATTRITAPRSALNVHQSHGTVTRPHVETGHHVLVSGAPGTHFEVWITDASGAATMLTAGTIPSGGSIGTSVHLPGSTPQPHSETVLVTSNADARVSVFVEYD